MKSGLPVVFLAVVLVGSAQAQRIKLDANCSFSKT